uniref:Uncharacterized protein n=1 Tax=Magallana gigas TaxID=29159 RepID=K1PNH6_MAGGI
MQYSTLQTKDRSKDITPEQLKGCAWNLYSHIKVVSLKRKDESAFLLLVVVAAIVGLVIGLLIGRFGIRSDNDEYRNTGISETFVQDAYPYIC